MTEQEVITYCETFITRKHNQIFAINAGFCDEQIAKWRGSRRVQREGCQIYIDSAQATLDDARAGVPLTICEVCEKPVSRRAVWCIHCGHPQPVLSSL